MKSPILACCESSDERLAWLRFFSGERAALSELTERFRLLWIERIRRLVRDRSRCLGILPIDPEDVLQRMLLDLWRRRLPIRVQNVGAYVSGIMDKAVISECRWQRGSRNAPPRSSCSWLDGSDEPISMLRKSADFADPIDTADQWAQILRRLTATERNLVQMVQAGHGWQAIGHRLAIRPQAARMRFHRIAARLRRHFTESSQTGCANVRSDGGRRQPPRADRTCISRSKTRCSKRSTG